MARLVHRVPRWPDPDRRVVSTRPLELDGPAAGLGIRNPPAAARCAVSNTGAISIRPPSIDGRLAPRVLGNTPDDDGPTAVQRGHVRIHSVGTAMGRARLGI